MRRKKCAIRIARKELRRRIARLVEELLRLLGAVEHDVEDDGAGAVGLRLRELQRVDDVVA